MTSFDHVHRLATALPEVTVGERWGNRTWEVGRQAFAWERPFSKADLRRFGDQTPPAGPILAVRVADLHEKEAVLAAGPAGVFTIPHLDGYAVLLVQLERVVADTLRDIVLDAWLACAPRALADAYLKQ